MTLDERAADQARILDMIADEGPMIHCMSWSVIQGALRDAAGLLRQQVGSNQSEIDACPGCTNTEFLVNGCKHPSASSVRPEAGAWTPFDDYMPPESCVLIAAEKSRLPIILHDENGNWWIRDALPLPRRDGS